MGAFKEIAIDLQEAEEHGVDITNREALLKNQYLSASTRRYLNTFTNEDWLVVCNKAQPTALG